ncbi:MAG: DUF4139 domain-containing protein [Gammaproteobacteria bacterium]|nr:DUF4139 domain-containing protein [Gammaproteobacteria bacterium]
MKFSLSILALSVCLASLAFADVTEQRTTLDDQTSVAVTIYNENLALIKDQRKLTLNKGFNNLAFRGVSARMRPETALLRSLNPNNQLRVLEQNFDFDLLTPQKLLEKYIGKQVRLATINPATGLETIETATVLSTNSGVVLKIGNKIITNPRGDYIFDNVPDNLRDKPTLVTQLTSSSAKTQTVELGYLTGGLSWKADYVAELNSDDTRLDLTGWVTLINQSGTQYNNAKLQLVAGDINQVQPRFARTKGALMDSMEMSAVADDGMAEESLFEYHLYTLARPTNLADKQTKQVALLSATSVPVTKQFLLQGRNYYYRSSYGQIGKKMKVGVFVEFKNSEKAQLGMPIPKGIVRVYKNDSKGNAQFIGEDGIDHTPKNEDIRLKLGDAFDVTANMKQTNFKKVPHYKHYNVAYESSYEIELKNAKSTPVTVTVREPVPGEWQMIRESQPHKKIASGTAQWQVTIPAESSQILSYTVRVQY